MLRQIFIRIFLNSKILYNLKKYKINILEYNLPYEFFKYIVLIIKYNFYFKYLLKNSTILSKGITFNLSYKSV